MPNFMDTLEGSVETITFYNPETGYCVMKIAAVSPTGGRTTPTTVTGVMPEVQPGEYVKIEGEWSNNPKYGRQFKSEVMTRVLPVNKEGMRRYLGSGLVKGVGEKTAEKIVDHFGLKTLEMLDSPRAAEMLMQVKDVGRHRAGAIAAAWHEQREIADVMMYLQQYRVGTALAIKIYRFYKDQDLSAIQVLQTDPYQLSRDIHGIGFKTADKIAQNIGLPAMSQPRLQAGLIYALEEAITNGHVFLPAPELFQQAGELLETDNTALLEEALRQLVYAGDVKTQDLPDANNPGMLVQAVYKPPLFHSERGAARRIRHMLDEPASRLSSFQKMSEAEVDRYISVVSKDQAVKLTDQQRGAVRMALTHKLSILTGGPGTGKTTTLRALIAALDAAKQSYLLASPTGRAAKRLNQATDRPAKTIHRMLGYSIQGFTFNEENTLDADMIIIDEASMLDLHLFYSLLRAVNLQTHLLLVGDIDQLPSVGAGDVLNDVIRSEVAPVTRLNAIFRQAGGSLIIQNAHQINQGAMPELNNTGEDFFFFGAEDPDKASELLVDVVQNRIPRKFGFDSIDDVQVLSPMYRSAVGVHALNIALQEALNPAGNKAEKRLGNETFRIGDKVMQMKNNYEKEVYNGDIGRIHAIDFVNQSIMVTMEERFVSYDWGEADQLTLAYACTVHRSQGSEYPVVVVPMLTQHFMMLQRNLLYTAITRARKLVVLIGMRKAVAIAVQNDKVSQRWSALAWLLQGG